MNSLPRKSDRQKLIEQCDINRNTVETLAKQLVEMQETIEAQATLINGYKAYASVRQAKGLQTSRRNKKSKYFFKGYTKELIKLITDKTLTSAQQRILFCTTPFLEKETNFILNKDGQRANKNEILDIIDMDKKTFDAALEGLSNMGIMFKIVTGNRNVNFMINPKLFHIVKDIKLRAEIKSIKELMHSCDCDQ